MEEAQLFKIERVSLLISPTTHSRESRVETGKGGRDRELQKDTYLEVIFQNLSQPHSDPQVDS